MTVTPDRPKVIIGRALIQALREASILGEDDKVSRVVIDIPTREPVIVYVERYGDERLLQVAQTLEGVQIRRDERPVEDPAAASPR